MERGTATGFVIEGGSSVPWLVTNRHVVDPTYRPSDDKFLKYKLHELQVTGRRANDTIYTFRLHPDAKIFFHDDAENDVAVIECRFIWEGVPEELRKLHWHFGHDQLANLATFEQSMRAFDLVCYSGFPNEHDKLGLRPIVRSGHIASDPRFDYTWDKQYRGQCVAYEGFSKGGSSGSPIYAPPRGATNIAGSRHGFLVGVNAGHIKSKEGFGGAHSGVSFFYKSTVIIEIMKSNGLLKFTATSS
ncbi:trypsin-like peptidase domain-containing protein [Duganella sp. BJB1802]|uniref:trypsin-like peptidase domain-containing protein n=1 Tax=Duganella sp. BJB1802 TaxID=2744575 RepID=UPI001593DCEC|nr:trypsin-like peptidase domain-containing protein [Duganella sp. BJB1802]